MSTTATGLEFISNTVTEQTHHIMRGYVNKYFIPADCDSLAKISIYSAKKILIEGENESLITNIPIREALEDIQEYVHFRDAMESPVTYTHDSQASSDELQIKTDNYIAQKLSRKSNF